MDENIRVPNHIAIILDGNRRWAKKRGFNTLQGQFNRNLTVLLV